MIEAVEEVFRLSQLDYDGIDILVQRSAANQEVKEALAAAKEEAERSPTWLGHCSGCTDPHSEGTHQMGTIEHPNPTNEEAERRVLTDEEIERTGEEEWDRQLANGSSGEQSHAYALGWKKALRYARDNGYLAPTTGLDVDGVMKIVEREVLTHQRISETLRGIRKALEANAEKGGDNLRTDPWISVEDRMPPNNTPVLGLRADTWGDKVHVEGFAIDDGGYWYFTQDGDVPEKTPTHWMPLPSPPDTDKG